MYCVSARAKIVMRFRAEPGTGPDHCHEQAVDWALAMLDPA